MVKGERVRLIILGFVKEQTDKGDIIYRLYIKGQENRFLFLSKKSYEPIYDRCLKKTNCISAVVELINEQKHNVVISNLRYCKNQDEEETKVG